jgi:organic radical activating enzyme
MREFPKFMESGEGKISVSETFYSIQGEGRYIGTPAVFLRTQGCLLNCVWCDTYQVWKSGKEYSFKELLDLWKYRGYIRALNRGAHIILTGGEPLARYREIAGFLNSLVERYTRRYNTPVEIETAGTVMPNGQLNDFYPYYNVSPKLANSGMDMERRNRPDVMKYLAELSWESNQYRSGSSFKFVVSNREDIQEAIDTYIEPYFISPSSVYIMAQAQTRKELQEREPMIVDLAKEYGLKYSTRLHLHIWDKATGV